MEIQEKPKQFTKTFKNFDGSEDIWIYDLDKSKGPIEVIIGYNENNFFLPEAVLQGIGESDKTKSGKQKITKQKFLNPSNGKYVAYGRAKQLGLI